MHIKIECYLLEVKWVSYEIVRIKIGALGGDKHHA